MYINRSPQSRNIAQCCVSVDAFLNNKENMGPNTCTGDREINGNQAERAHTGRILRLNGLEKSPVWESQGGNNVHVR